ncbi:hypothetical protein QAD02_018763 [Eretmocerus hayati]|uniref:Uncharacterized protein n=1 Tax=Eretmocerus hayati TaxID=131215 RepID=A0ACC2PHQ3_9HYME|nr:hypothetical protein QAD02_018763 [Eretmocerus hayati]
MVTAESMFEAMANDASSTTDHQDFDLDVCSEVDRAIHAEDFQTLRRLINTRFGTQKQRNTTCLYQAIDRGNLEIVKMLLDAGVDRDYYEDTEEYGLPTEPPRISPLHRAVDIQNVELQWRMVQLLIYSGISPKNEHLYQESCMCLAVKRGNLEMVKFLFEHGAEVNCARQIVVPSDWSFDGNPRKFMEWSPLHYAVRDFDGKLRVDMVKLLLQMGADANVEGWLSGERCLHILSERKSGSCDVFKILFEAGAELNCLSESGSTPLAMAALYGDIKLMEMMIAAGADINLFKKDLCSPLRFAVSGFDSDAVQLLLENGADPNAEDEAGDNILCWAADFHDGKNKVTEYIDILRMLLSYGAKNELASVEKNVPFMAVLAFGTKEAMQLFFEYGVTLDNCRVSHPLHHAAQNARKEILDYLLKSNRYDVDEVHYGNKEDCTPLIVAVCTQQYKNVRLLIEWGADVNISLINENYVGSSVTSPLFEALDQGDVKIVDLLLSAGAEMNAKNDCECWQRTRDKVLSPRFRRVLSSIVGEAVLLRSQSYSNQNNENLLMKRFTGLSPEIENRCLVELEEMKSITFYGSCTYYDLLRGKDVTRFVKNIRVIQAFESLRVVERFPIYGNRMKNCYALAKVKRKLIDKAIVNLNKALCFRFSRYHEILCIILSHLRLKDLRHLCIV